MLSHTDFPLGVAEASLKTGSSDNEVFVSLRPNRPYDKQALKKSAGVFAELLQASLVHNGLTRGQVLEAASQSSFNYVVTGEQVPNADGNTVYDAMSEVLREISRRVTAEGPMHEEDEQRLLLRNVLEDLLHERKKTDEPYLRVEPQEIKPNAPAVMRDTLYAAIREALPPHATDGIAHGLTNEAQEFYPEWSKKGTVLQKLLHRLDGPFPEQDARTIARNVAAAIDETYKGRER
jgi:hypothetical protein